MSNKKCVREKYLYLSAMLRAREAKMLTRDKAERMIDAPSFDEAAKMLTDCGYKDRSKRLLPSTEPRYSQSLRGFRRTRSR